MPRSYDSYIAIEPSLRGKTLPTSAFTLIELLVVCLLIAIMAALIVPEMRGSFEDALLRANGRKLIDVLSLTYSRAVSANQLHRLRLDTFTGKYLIEKQTGDGEDDSDFEPATEVNGFAGQLDPRVSLRMEKIRDTDSDSDAEPTNSPSAADAISFYPDGTAQACEISLRDRMGFQLILQVDPRTARVHLVDSASQP